MPDAPQSLSLSLKTLRSKSTVTWPDDVDATHGQMAVAMAKDQKCAHVTRQGRRSQHRQARWKVGERPTHSAVAWEWTQNGNLAQAYFSGLGGTSTWGALQHLTRAARNVPSSEKNNIRHAPATSSAAEDGQNALRLHFACCIVN